MGKMQEDDKKANEFDRFLFDMFPENIAVELRQSQMDLNDLSDLDLSECTDSEYESEEESEEEEEEEHVQPACSRFSAHTVKWVDTRVQGEQWRELFFKVSSTDEEIELGCPPELDFGKSHPKKISILKQLQ